jgi:hypothetical protein
VGPRAGVDTEARGKIISPLPGTEPRSSVCSQTVLIELPRLTAALSTPQTGLNKYTSAAQTTARETHPARQSVLCGPHCFH